MKLVKTILICFTGILIIPIFSLFTLSLKATDGNYFKWYFEIIKNEKFITAFFNSFYISLIISSLTIITSFIISLAYFEKRKRLLIVFFVLIIGLMPPDIIALSISKSSQIIGFKKSNLFFLCFGLLIYSLPFGIIILWIRYYFIDKFIIIASEDIGLSNVSIIIKILFPLSKNSLISVFLFSFLLTFNEYSRTFYLSGSDEYLSEFLNGKLSSGTDNSIYAGATISILATCLIILIYGIIIKKSKFNNKTNIIL